MSLALAQGPETPNEGSRLTYDNTIQTSNFSWWGQYGKSYFVQHSVDLVNWSYYPMVVLGQYDVAELNFQTNAARYFLRLELSDDPWNTDSDGDGIPDGYEILYGLNPHNPNDAFDIAPSGLTYLQAYQQGQVPTVPDTDGDGVKDNLDGVPSDPDLSPAPVPEAGYAVLDLTLAGLSADDIATMVNNKNQIVGNDLTAHPFFWDQGVRTVIPMFSALGLNNNGVVSGLSLFQDANNTTYVARWAVGQSSPTLLYGYKPPPPAQGGSESVHEPVFINSGGINDSMSIVGSSSSWIDLSNRDPANPDSTVNYFCGTVWNGTTNTPALVGQLRFDLPSDSPDICDPLTLNNAGNVVGSMANGDYDAFVSTGSTVARLPKLTSPSPYNGAQYPWASIINQAGTIMAGGMSQSHPVMWVKKQGVWKAKNIGPYNKTTQQNGFVAGGIYGMNERMEMVGQLYGTSFNAFLWQNGKLVDLNTRVPSVWKVNTAYFINDSGIIAGKANPIDKDGQATGPNRPALLLPVDTIQMDAFIPEEWVYHPFLTYIYNGNSRKTPLDGNNYTSGPATFSATSADFKLRQKVGVTAKASIGTSNMGIISAAENRTRKTDVGPTKEYSSSVLVNGHIPAGTVPRATQIATPRIDTVTITHPSPGVVVAQMEMKANDPLVDASYFAPIHWQITVTINRSDPSNPIYHVTGTHCRFPAYELYINGQSVHGFDPVSGGYGPSDLFRDDRTFDNTEKLNQ